MDTEKIELYKRIAVLETKLEKVSIMFDILQDIQAPSNPHNMAIIKAIEAISKTL